MLSESPKHCGVLHVFKSTCTKLHLPFPHCAWFPWKSSALSVTLSCAILADLSFFSPLSLKFSNYSFSQVKWAKCWVARGRQCSELSQIHGFDHLRPSRLGAHEPSVSRAGMGNPPAPHHASQTAGCWRGRQQSSRSTAVTPPECHHHFHGKEHCVLDVLCFEWHLPYLCPNPSTQVCEQISTWAMTLKNKQMGPG